MKSQRYMKITYTPTTYREWKRKEKRKKRRREITLLRER